MKKIFLVILFSCASASTSFALTAHNIPDFCASPTRTASVSGSWSNTATWGGAAVPGAGAIVKINNGVTVTYDVNSPTAIKAVCTSGLLDFGTSGTKRLVTSELLVYSDGELRIGTTVSPFTGTATIEFSGTLDVGTVGSPGSDTEQWGVGLIVIGKLRVHGSSKTGFLRLAAAPGASATTLTLPSVPTGWNSGDEVVIPESVQRSFDGGPAPSFSENPLIKRYDRRTLSANVTSTTASLSSGLAYAHPCGLDATLACTYYPHAANLTRNIVFRSTNPGGVRGHGIAVERADIDIRYVLFKDMGRTTIANLHCTLFTTGALQGDSNCSAGTGALTQIGTNQKGRYAFHFHHVFGPVNIPNTGYQGTFIGNAIVDSTKWPLTIHNSNYLLVQGNVIAAYDGPGMFMEDGNEHFNVIDANFMCCSSSNVDPRNGDEAFGGTASGGREAAGFWAKGGTNNYIINNVSASHWNTAQQIITDVGYKLFIPSGGLTVKIPNFRGADLNQAGEYTTADARAIPILQFENNEAYGLGAGMTIWHSGTDGYVLIPIGQSTIRDLAVWNYYEDAFFGYPIHNYVFDGLFVRADPAKLSFGNTNPCGWTSGDYKNNGVTLRNFDIQNIGIAVCDIAGIDQSFTYQDSISKTAIGITIEGFSTPGTQASPLGDRNLTISNVVHSTINSLPLKTIVMQYDPHGNSAQSFFYADTLPQTTTVSQYQGGATTFRVYFPEQATQNVAGGLAPCTDTTTRPEITGITCVVGGGTLTAPVAPSNLALQ